MISTEQLLALRLADELDLYANGDRHQRATEEAATELRRLHAVNEELLEALQAASNYIDTLGGVSQSYRAAIVKARGEA